MVGRDPLLIPVGIVEDFEQIACLRSAQIEEGLQSIFDRLLVRGRSGGGKDDSPYRLLEIIGSYLRDRGEVGGIGIRGSDFGSCEAL